MVSPNSWKHSVSVDDNVIVTYLDFLWIGARYVLFIIFHDGGSPRLGLAIYGLLQLLPPEK